MIAMLRKLSRLFVIKTRIEAYIVCFALAVGAMERGRAYLTEYPGTMGVILFWACSGSVIIGGAKILDALRYEREQSAAVIVVSE